MKKHPYLVIGGLVFWAALLLYSVTLAPSVVTLFDDSLEFQLVTYQLGIAHPTGYPLYTILGKLFTFIPIGNVAMRVNLMSAVFGATTVTTVYVLITQIINFSPLTLTLSPLGEGTDAPSPPGKGGWGVRGKSDAQPPPHWFDHLGGVMGAILLALGPIFWQQATIAEVYTLNAFFVALLLLLMVYQSHPQPTPLPNSWPGVYGIAFMAGLSLTHHRTMVLLLPAITVYLLLSYGKQLFSPKLIGMSVLLFLLPLLLYLYLPWRGHIGSLDGTYQNSWVGFWQQITASGYGTTFLLDNPFGHARNLAFYGQLLVDQFYTLLPGFIGLLYLGGTDNRRFVALTGLALLTYLPFNLFYNVSDIEVFFIPIFLIWAVWSGLGVAYILRLIARLTKPWRMALTSLVLLGCLFMVGQLWQTGYTVVSQKYSWQVHDYGVDMLRQPFSKTQPSTIVGLVGEMTLLRYFQQTDNQRPEVETVAADLEADRIAAVERLLNQGKAVYLTRELPDAAGRWSLSAVGPLIQVNPTPITTLPNAITSLNQPVTPEITLAGYTVSRVPHTGAGYAPVRLTLYWQAEAPIPADLKVSARLLAPNGEVAAVVDAIPVHFAYPTSVWRLGEIVADVYDLPLPDTLDAKPYTPLIIWYNPTQNAAEVGRIELPRVEP